jgi:hypothetical protein
MYAYDTLLMPERFWGERRPRRRRRWLVDRPPSGSPWVLYLNMRRIWSGLFTIATLLAVAGIATLGYAALDPHTWAQIGVLAGAGVAVAALSYWFRPIIGSED